jgi:myosin-crossreactive antigen
MIYRSDSLSLNSSFSINQVGSGMGTESKAYLLGGGIGSLAAAAFMSRNLVGTRRELAG